MPDKQASELSEQLIGTLISLCAFALFLVWAISAPPIIRYGVTGLIVFLLVFWVVSATHKQSKLRKIRDQDIRDHTES